MKQLFLLILLSVALFSCHKKDGTGNDPKSILTAPAAMAKGINLSNWFNDYSDHAQFGNRFTVNHFTTFKQAGFTYVRIPIGSSILFQPATPSILNPVNLPFVEAAVNRALNAGLAVTINYHPASEDYEKLMSTDTVLQRKLADYWYALADHFKSYDTTKLFFEVYNEPHVATANMVPGLSRSWWDPVQLKLIQAVRAAAPSHYIIAGGEGWNSLDGLQLLLPYNVSKIVYNFHFYEPFVFTHQGASWVGSPMDLLRNVPYPVSPALIAPVIAATADNNAKDLLTWYGGQNYDSAKLASMITPVANWAKYNHMPLICNEFGSYKAYAPRDARLKLVHDVRCILEKNGIGWAMWEADEGFGFIEYPGSDRSVFNKDQVLLQALGL